MRIVWIVFAGLLGLLGVLWLGLRVQPKPFALHALLQTEVQTMPLPEGLPKPVERFYRTMYGEEIPIVESVVITGRGRIRPFKVWMPTRFVIVHEAGKDYRHYFEATFFGLPFLKVQEGYVDGESFFESPMGTYYDDLNTNQGANLALWAEGGWFPSLWLTDPRARWAPVDDHTALLFVPYGDGEESFVVRFNPETGLVDLMEVMRFKAPTDKSKTLWLPGETRAPGQPSIFQATWLDEGRPWAEFICEDILFNVDVREFVRQRGP